MALIRAVVTSGPAAPSFARLAVPGRRGFGEGGRRVTQDSREGTACRMARPATGDDTGTGEPSAQAARHQSAAPRLHQAAQPWQCDRLAYQISNVGKWECRQYPGLRRTRASANTSGPDFTMARRPLVKLRSPFFGEPHRTKKTRFFCRTVKANDPTVDLMSRRHPLSSIRTSMRR